MPEKPDRLSRKDLYDLVWKTPLSRLGPDLGLSGRGLAKLCAREGVPVPPRGYWAKFQHGKAPDPPPLPEKWPVVKPPIRSDEREAKPPSRHPVLDGAKGHFEAARETQIGFLKPLKKLIVDVFVSKGAIERALEVANQFFLKLREHGYPVAIAPAQPQFHRPSVDVSGKQKEREWGWDTWGPLRPTVVYIGDVAFGVTIFEFTEQVEVRLVGHEWVPVAEAPVPKRRRRGYHDDWTSWHELPSGTFCLRICSPYPGTSWMREWHEKKAGELPRKFTTIVRTLKREAPNIVKLVEEAEREQELARTRWEEQRKIWEREEQERQRREAVKRSREELLGAIESWGKAKRIEEFFADVERRASGLNDDERKALLDRLGRAQELIGEADALKRLQSWKSPDELCPPRPDQAGDE